MFDIHIHILPGLDDGPADMEASLDLARACVAAGTGTVIATPHIRDDHPFPLSAVREGVDAVRGALAEEGLALDVLPGGEVSIEKAAEMTDAELEQITLGGSGHVLLESPYGHATDFLERAVFDVQLRGFGVVLAHPERSPSFQSDVGRLGELAERGVLTSITAASMTGRFGRTVQRAAVAMLEAGVVHSVASDAHDAERRPPGLAEGFDVLDEQLPGLAAASAWFTTEVPGAILERRPLPPRPPVGGRRGRFRLPWSGR